MLASTGVVRVVPDLASQSLAAARAFYGEALELELVLDLGWIMTVGDPARPGVQISLLTHGSTAPAIPVASVQVDDVDACYAASLRASAEFVHPLTDETWGVRRFSVRTPTVT
jgi:hypothetical protein